MPSASESDVSDDGKSDESGQLSLLFLEGREMSSSLRAGVAD